MAPFDQALGGYLPLQSHAENTSVDATRLRDCRPKLGLHDACCGMLQFVVEDRRPDVGMLAEGDGVAFEVRSMMVFLYLAHIDLMVTAANGDHLVTSSAWKHVLIVDLDPQARTCLYCPLRILHST